MDLRTLTQGTVDGEGVFDQLMRALRVHLDQEFTKGRLTGEDYAKSYTALTATVLQQAIQYVLTEPQSAAQVSLIESQVTQTDAQTQLIAQERANAVVQGQNLTKQGNVIDKQVETATAEIARIEAQTAQVDQQTSNLAAEALNIPKQGLILDTQKAQLDAEIVQLGKQGAMVDQQVINLGSENANLITQNSLLLKQVAKAEADTNYVNAQITSMGKQDALTQQQTDNLAAEALNIPKQGVLLDKQASRIDEEITASSVNRTYVTAQTGLVNAQKDKAVDDLNVNAAQINKVTAEIDVLTQRKLTEQAQISDTVDGSPVTGVIGKQKELYSAQVTGFTRDAEQKVLKTFADVWSIQRSTDSTLSPEDPGFGPTTLAAVVSKVANGIGVNVTTE